MKDPRKTVLVPPLSYDAVRESIAGFHALGILTVATILQDAGEHVVIVNPGVRVRDLQETVILDRLAAEILADDPDIIGFSTTCLFYALTLLTAKRCKALRPSCTVILGGPQATATSYATLDQCPWIDVVVEGEADLTAVALWKGLGETGDMTAIQGVVFRRDDGIHRTGPPQRLLDLDRAATPDFSLLPCPPWEREERIPVEAGRGCAFRCGFCSTRIFWGDSPRFKSVERLVSQMRSAAQQTGRGRFHLVHDMFVQDREWVMALCRRFQSMDPLPRWACGARVDCLDPGLLEEMASAGCEEVYCGIESVSSQIQDLIGKRFPLAQVRDVYRQMSRVGIRPATALIAGFPEETKEDLLESLEFALRLYDENGGRARIKIFVLAPLAQTPFIRRYEGCLRLDSYLNPDLDFLPFQAPSCRLFIEEHRELCSAAYHYLADNISHDTVVRLSVAFDHLIKYPLTFEILRRLFEGRLASALFTKLPFLEFAVPWEMHQPDTLARRMEGYVDAVLGAAATRIPYWRDLYRYEGAQLAVAGLTSDERVAGRYLTLAYDVRSIRTLLRETAGLPSLTPSPHPLNLWHVEIGGSMREIVLPFRISLSRDA